MWKRTWYLLRYAGPVVAIVLMLLGCEPILRADVSTPAPNPTQEPTASPTQPAQPTPVVSTPSLRWQRISGPDCSTLRVDDLTQLHYAPCGEAERLAHFEQEELQAYLTYVALYEPFIYGQTPSASNDMATVALEFVGRGTRAATDYEQTEVAAWAAQIYERLYSAELQGDALAQARLLLSQNLGVSIADIDVVSVESRDWPDTCLGIAETGRDCAQVITPGYRITLMVGTDTYVYHADLHGVVRLASTHIVTQPTPQPTSTPVPSTPVPTATPFPTPIATPVYTSPPAPRGYWQAEYFANPDLSGYPAAIVGETSLSHNWGYSAPVAGVPADYFSARYSQIVHFEEGKYSFRLEADDGVRLWVAGNLLIDRWYGGDQVNVVSNQQVWTGDHLVVLEYFELQGYAKIDLGWQRIAPTPVITPEPIITEWRAEYYNNPFLDGKPALVRNETRVAFDWGEGSPDATINKDRFSASFTRRLNFPPGLYRLSLAIDDGARLYVDDHLVIEAWQAAIRRIVTHDTQLNGQHEIRIEYFEEGGSAALFFGADQLSGPSPTPTRASSPSPRPSPTPVQTATPRPTPTPTQTPADVWTAEYYGNMDLAGTPLVIREESAIAFEWGEGSPHHLLHVDHFSARFTRAFDLTPGYYRISVVADDGVRVYVDGEKVIDAWNSSTRRLASYDMLLSGEHTIRIEYFENGGGAALYFGLEALPLGKTTPTPSPMPLPSPTPSEMWQAAYYGNPVLEGTPLVTGEEEQITFDWKEGSPHHLLDVDRFSAVFTRTLELPRGTYRLHLVVDDGARIYVDGELVLDEWQVGIRRHTIQDVELGGKHTIRVEYFEEGGGAAIYFAWEALGTGEAGRRGLESDSLSQTLNAARGFRSPYARFRRSE